MDTITAYSGGAMPCAIGIVRLSGENAQEIYRRIFRQKKQTVPHMLSYGEALGRDGSVIDLCMGVFFRSPKSYTGEDMAEIYCHGSVAVVEELLRAAQQHGARMAQAGEFTERGFLNGKLDLTSAEAVGDLIHAQSLQSAKAAIGQLKGGIFRQINGIYQEVTELLAHFYAVCDYTDEDIADWQYADAAVVFARSAAGLTGLCATFERGNIVKNGLPVAIIGRTNAGKSSLLNALLGYERAIVTGEAGTTRDTIEECMQIGGALFRLTDTAGLRETENIAEKMGIARSGQAAQAAQLVICLLDGTEKCNQDDEMAIKLALSAPNAVFVVNKADLGGKIPEQVPQNQEVFLVSALTGQGIDQLVRYLSGLAAYDDRQVILTNARQAGLLQKAAEAFANAAQGASMGITADALLFDAEAGLRYLGEVIGKNPNADMVKEIFSKFCVGK